MDRCRGPGYNVRMKPSVLAILLAAALAQEMTLVPAAAASAPANEPANTEIRSVLQAQEAAWNRGDLEAFMNGYECSEKTVFVGGDEVTRGWQTVLDRYKAKYSDREKMGTLAFSDLEITPLGPDAAVALGRWELKRAKDHPHGRFTLIFRRAPDGWHIVHDHSSAASG